MAVNIKEHIKRALGPRLLITYFKFKMKRRTRPTLQRLFGQPGSIDLFFAFDCPYSLVALTGLYEILDERSVVLNLFPVINRGIENDPDIELRRSYSIKDAARMSKRKDIEIKRTAPLDPDQTGFLAALSEAGRGPRGGELIFRFLEKVWSFSGPEIQEEPFYALYEEIIGEAPPEDLEGPYQKIRENEALLKKKGHWEVPSLLVYGEWYFAHERITQIEERLNYLGW